MKRIIRQFVPPFVLQVYHWLLARLGAVWYGYPSRQLIVIGVTGTKGKSSVVTLISRLLEAAGHRVGAMATTHFKIGEREWVNDTKQTMPGRFRLQKLLKQMLAAHCRYVVIETSSEGIAQYRHLGIIYDVVVFTNLAPEHIESHGSYERYRQAKGKIFKRLGSSRRKKIDGQEIKKVIVVNADDKEANYFLAPPADTKWIYGLDHKFTAQSSTYRQLVARDIVSGPDGVSFVVNNELIKLQLLGLFNVYNVLAALAVGFSQGIDLSVMKKTLEQIKPLPGRLEEIKNNKGFRVFVDYAHEPSSLVAVYKTIKALHPNRIISVLGSQGGGRDKAKRPRLGLLAARYTDYVIVTNEDPYDEDPQQIIDEVIAGTLSGGKELEKNCWSILDRREAISKALSLAGQGDIVIITGKGSETVMAVNGGKLIDWDDRQVVRELLES